MSILLHDFCCICFKSTSFTGTPKALQKRVDDVIYGDLGEESERKSVNVIRSKSFPQILSMTLACLDSHFRKHSLSILVKVRWIARTETTANMTLNCCVDSCLTLVVHLLLFLKDLV